MNLLNPCRSVRRHANVYIGVTQQARDLAASSTGQGDDAQFVVMRRVNRFNDVGRVYPLSKA